MTMKTIDVIDAVLTIFAKPEAWTKGAAARDAVGRPVQPTSSAAVAWGLDGAIEHVVGNWEDTSLSDAEAERRRQLELATFDRLGVSVAAFNDAAGYKGVTGLLRSQGWKAAIC